LPNGRTSNLTLFIQQCATDNASAQRPFTHQRVADKEVMTVSPRWPRTAEALIDSPLRLAAFDPPPWRPVELDAVNVAAAWVSFARGASGRGAAGDPAWAAAVTMRGPRVTEHIVVPGQAAGGYFPGLLALRIGPLLDEAVTRLTRPADVLLVDATGRDHPRRAGLAVHLGAVLDLPTVGVTHRPLIAAGAWPEDRTDASAPLLLADEPVGFWLRSRAGARPIAVHAGWRTDPESALAVVLACKGRMRTPAPLRHARQRARLARIGS
jgi:deoxyribonuclease V